MKLMGITLFIGGLVILVFGCGPYLLASLLFDVRPGDVFVLTVLAGAALRLGVTLTVGGALFCAWKNLLDRLPY